MQGLQLTYETLGKTRNEAAVDVLVAALADAQPENRRRALAAILARPEERSSQQVLENWDLLQADDLRVLRQKKQWMAPAIEKSLKEGSENMPHAIAAAKSLGSFTSIPHLVLIAESSGSRPLRAAASDAVIELAQPLGQDARADRDQPTVRGPVLKRLADSVRRFSMHRNEKLVDAFLLVVTWGDGDFRQLISEGSPQLDLICRRLRESECTSVNDLLAGFIRYRNIPDWISEIIRTRQHGQFREALLRTVGAEPSATVLRNLNVIGMPQSCEGGESLIREVAPEYRAALAHLYTAADSNDMRKLHVVASAAESGGPGCETAAALCLARCEVPEVDIWMRAALPIADGDQALIQSDNNARLLQRLIDLLGHSDPALERSVRRILEPLHADEMLHRFEALRPRSRRRLGRVVMMIDPDAIDRIRDALRHPVLSRRLEAIATADALAIVDLLADSFKHIAREDHQEARMRAADAMSNASSEATLGLLREMVELPESPVRDAAVASLRRRENAIVQ